MFFVKRYSSSKNSSTIHYAFTTTVGANKYVCNKCATWYSSLQDSSSMLEVPESNKLEYGSGKRENDLDSYSSF